MKERITKRKIKELEKQITKYEDENWENFNRHRLNDEVTVWNLNKWVAFVLETWKLPKKVRTFVWAKCQFELFSPSDQKNISGRMINIQPRKKYIILILHTDPFGKMIGPNIAATIGHEIAHAWLGHKGMVNKKQAREREKEATEQAKAWGVPMW